MLLNGSILVALVLAGLGWHQVDAWFGLGIAAYIFWSAVQIARESFTVLMDEELPTGCQPAHARTGVQRSGRAGRP
jgi:divalent metal cation (Fe/Co/Zn/Cd) transporter